MKLSTSLLFVLATSIAGAEPGDLNPAVNIWTDIAHAALNEIQATEPSELSERYESQALVARLLHTCGHQDTAAQLLKAATDWHQAQNNLDAEIDGDPDAILWEAVIATYEMSGLDPAIQLMATAKDPYSKIDIFTFSIMRTAAIHGQAEDFTSCLDSFPELFRTTQEQADDQELTATDYYYNMGEAAAILGKTALVDKYAAELITSDPTTAVGLLAVAAVRNFERNPHDPDAIRWLKQAVELDAQEQGKPDAKDIFFMPGDLAGAHAAAGDIPAAMNALNNIQDFISGRIWAMAQIAKAYHRQGKTKDCHNLLNAAFTAGFLEPYIYDYYEVGYAIGAIGDQQTLNWAKKNLYRLINFQNYGPQLACWFAGGIADGLIHHPSGPGTL